METRFSLTEFGHEYTTVDSVDVSGAMKEAPRWCRFETL